MFAFLIKLLLVARSRLKTRASLVAENLVLRQQVIVLSRKAPSRVRLCNIERLFSVWLYRCFPGDSECDHGGQARDRDPLASAWLACLLALEIPGVWWPPEDRPRDPRPHPADEQGKLTAGSAADPRRTADARDRGRAINRGAVHDQAARASLSGLEDIPAQSRRRDRAAEDCPRRSAFDQLVHAGPLPNLPAG